MAESVDATDLKSVDPKDREGSSPSTPKSSIIQRIYKPGFVFGFKPKSDYFSKNINIF